MGTATYNSSDSWQAPAGVFHVQVECWGSGGNGFPGNNIQSGGGGGGGAYAKVNSYTVIPGNSYSLSIGLGQKTTFNTNGCIADYGRDGTGYTHHTPTGGAGGSSGASTGNTTVAGGVGGSGSNTSSLGGGGGGGCGGGQPTSNGEDTGYPNGRAGGPGGNSGGGGGAGGNSKDGSAPHDGVNGTAPGGGGGGAGTITFPGTTTGGTSAVGRVKLIWTDPTNVLVNLVSQT